MKSFTSGTPEMLRATIDALHEPYSMTLSPADMGAVLALLATAGSGFVTLEDISSETRERAFSVFSDVASTLGVEGV